MNAAVYVDFENLYLSLKNRTETTGLRTRELSLHILEGLLVRLRENSTPMTVGRSYAAFDTYPGVEVAHDLALMGLDPQYVLISHSGKNSADIQLSLDVARVVFRRPDIEMIVIVSGDRDFIPLARQVLEEGRELRVVAIPDTTSGDLRARVGDKRFWNALDLIADRSALLGDGGGREHAPGQDFDEGIRGEENGRPPAAAAPAPVAQAAAPAAGSGDGTAAAARPDRRVAARPDDDGSGPTIVGHIPVTWKTTRDAAPESQEVMLQQCLELLLRARLRHSSDDIWLSPFLKGPMSQHFSNLVHPERRALINELRNRGIIKVEERENQYADHPYSVIVIEDDHPMAQSAWTRVQRGTR